MRQAQYAGLFYERGEVSLKQQIQACFEDDKGPGATPSKKGKTPVGVIAPHAGYEYSGPCAAWSYKAVGEASLADVYVIIAPSHKGKSGLTMEPFSTPLGIVRVDQDFARRLVEKGNIRVHDEAFEGEHSIEVQLPFLQFSHMNVLEKIKILPLLVSDDLDLAQLALDIKETLIETNKKALFITSTDFTHYGKNYGFSPYYRDIQENVARLDKEAIEHIRRLDFEGLENYVTQSATNICGVQAISLMLRIIKAKKVDLEQYYTSAEITKDEKNSVSYASIVFW